MSWIGVSSWRTTIKIVILFRTRQRKDDTGREAAAAWKRQSRQPNQRDATPAQLCNEWISVWFTKNNNYRSRFTPFTLTSAYHFNYGTHNLSFCFFKILFQSRLFWQLKSTVNNIRSEGFWMLKMSFVKWNIMRLHIFRSGYSVR